MFYPAGTTLAGMSRTGRDRTAGRRTRCRASAAWSFTAAGWPEARSRVIANPAAGAGNGVDEPRAWAVGPDLAAQVAEARWRAGQRPGAGGRSPTDGVNLMARVSLNRSRSHPTRAAPAAAAPALHAARRGDPRVCPGRGWLARRGGSHGRRQRPCDIPGRFEFTPRVRLRRGHRLLNPQATPPITPRTASSQPSVKASPGHTGLSPAYSIARSVTLMAGYVPIRVRRWSAPRRRAAGR